MKFMKLFHESLDMFDKNGKGYIDINILMDILIDIADETGNNLKYPSENFREVPFGGGVKFKSYNRKDLSYQLKFPIFISTIYYHLLKQALDYYYKETSDDICCHIEYSSKKDKINSIRFFINNNKEIYSFNEKDFQQIMTRFGKYKYSTFLRMSEINYKSKQF